MTLADLAEQRYVSLTTFRKDGTPVSTPVWVAGDEGGRLLVWTGANTWKVKRIRRDHHVRVASCTGFGKVRGDAIDAHAEIVSDSDLVRELEQRKYGWERRFVVALNATVRWIRRRPPAESVTLVISEEPGRTPAETTGTS